MLGVESQAVVEFASYQKIPPEKKKVDNRNGTIEKGTFFFPNGVTIFFTLHVDEDYISFLESLKAASNAEPISLDDLSKSLYSTQISFFLNGFSSCLCATTSPSKDDTSS